MEINPIELPKLREKLMKCKIITLIEMNKDPLLNIKYLSLSEKTDIFDKVKILLESDNDDYINKKFNQICNEKLFNNTSDYSKYASYVDARFPEQQQKLDQEEPQFLQLKEDIKTNKLIMDIAGNIINTNN
jgi:hypothetical protein